MNRFVFMLCLVFVTTLGTGCADPIKKVEEALKAQSITQVSVKPVEGQDRTYSFTGKYKTTSRSCRGTVTLSSLGAEVKSRCDKPAPTVPTDPHEKLAYDCDKKDVKACYKLGVLHRKREVAAPDMKTARGLFKKACKGNVYEACEALGFFALRKLGGPLDLGEAEFAFSRACNAGVVRGCTHLAHVHVQNRKWSEARKVFKGACDQGDMKACNGYGARLNSKFGKEPVDRKGARKIFLKACNADYMNACTNYGLMLSKGQGGKKNMKAAKRYLEKACQGGDEPGCYSLKELN